MMKFLKFFYRVVLFLLVVQLQLVENFHAALFERLNVLSPFLGKV